MSKIVTSIIVSLILVIIIPTVLADSSISLSTDKTLYHRGDTIVIFGQVSETSEGLPIRIEIFNGGNLIEIAQLVLSQDGNYTHTVIVDGSQWINPGTHTIRASYGENTLTEVNFDFITSSIPEPIPDEVIAEPESTPQPFPEPKPKSELEVVFEGASEPELKPIPEWVKRVFAFWADGQISDQELKNAIKFLVQNGIIIL